MKFPELLLCPLMKDGVSYTVSSASFPSTSLILSGLPLSVTSRQCKQIDLYKIKLNDIL